MSKFRGTLADYIKKNRGTDKKVTQTNSWLEWMDTDETSGLFTGRKRARFDDNEDAQRDPLFDSESQASLPSLRADTQDDIPDWARPEAMEIEGGGDEPMPEARQANSTSGPGGNPQSKETPISNYPALSYGLQETHTTIIPFNFWFSMVGMTHNLPTKLQFRLNAVDDIIITSMTGLSEGSGWAQSGSGS